MEQTVRLDKQDLIRIIAERYNVMPSQVEVYFKTDTVGYGLSEREEQTAEAVITLTGDQQMTMKDGVKLLAICKGCGKEFFRSSLRPRYCPDCGTSKARIARYRAKKMATNGVTVGQ